MRTVGALAPALREAAWNQSCCNRGTVTYATLKIARYQLLAFSKDSGLREAHCLVQLPSGRWCLTLGTPENAVHIRGNIWRVKAS